MQEILEEEHPDDCPGCQDCFFDEEAYQEAVEEEEKQRQIENAEFFEATFPIYAP